MISQGLTAEDLLFFDTHSGPVKSAAALSQSSGGSELLLDLANGSFSPPPFQDLKTVRPGKALETSNQEVKRSEKALVNVADDDDGFGDFVEFEDEADKTAVSTATSTDGPLIDPSPVSPIAQPTFKETPNIQSSIERLAHRDNSKPLAFGLHLDSNTNTLTAGDWKGLLSATEGPKIPNPTVSTSKNRSNPAPVNHSDVASFNAVTPDNRLPISNGTFPSTKLEYESTQSPIFASQLSPIHSNLPSKVSLISVEPSEVSSGQQNPLKSHLSKTAFTPVSLQPIHTKIPVEPQPTDSGFDDWGTFEGDLITVDEYDAEDNSGPTSPTIPPPDHLCELFNQYVLPIVENLFQELVPLSYTLKKRVIAHPRTQAFTKGFLETMAVAARIMAGRHRRHGGPNSDREARELERNWSLLAPRIRTLIPPRDLSFELNAKVTFEPSSGNREPVSIYCKICGLSKTEHIKGFKKPTWDQEQSSHKSCSAWWNNRTAFGIPLSQ